MGSAKQTIQFDKWRALELIDILKDKTTPQIKDGSWTTYRVNDVYIGVEYYKRNK